MCGIVAYVGTKPCASILIDGLKRLEYRGYDSAGLALLNGEQIHLRRAVGKLSNLEQLLSESPIQGSTGIGHTRWATHGRPSEVNAHPHVVDDVAVVHNGIFENHLELRGSLEQQGIKMSSDTDTEIVAHLIALARKRTNSLKDAVKQALSQVRGSYALAVICLKEPQTIVVAKNASPLVVGKGENGEMLCASDIPALLPYTRDVLPLEDGDLAVLEPGKLHIEDSQGKSIERETHHIQWSAVMAEKDGFKHFMLKEIHEQPRAVEDTLRGRLHRSEGRIEGKEIGLDADAVAQIKRVYLLACGTSYHAALLGRDYIERFAKIPTTIELASEFRGRDAVICPGDLVIAISQSGETLDTLMAAKQAKAKGAKVLSVCNVLGSALPRMSDAAFYTHAGPEIGVASTKCFTTQVTAMLLLSIYFGGIKGTLSKEQSTALIEDLVRVPQLMRDTLANIEKPLSELAKSYSHARDVLFLGRGLSFPIALEGALKLKEISYIHAEGYSAGEMKHGPIALIDDAMPVVVVLPKDEHYEKTLANLQEARARDGKVIAITFDDTPEVDTIADEVIRVTTVQSALSPLFTVLPLQLFSYFVADAKGTDVDQPRNLAKTVTVE
ncbi:MAG: glutamine--fructose-6-phosphate transaminase (isomerizing) [Myxococcales bacterium]|nr:MAG: glutamine--fructose-6-phosphate transaminase (isomerizing) [Myxococcales bacterium]